MGTWLNDFLTFFQKNKIKKGPRSVNNFRTKDLFDILGEFWTYLNGPLVKTGPSCVPVPFLLERTWNADGTQMERK